MFTREHRNRPLALRERCGVTMALAGWLFWGGLAVVTLVLAAFGPGVSWDRRLMFGALGLGGVLVWVLTSEKKL